MTRALSAYDIWKMPVVLTVTSALGLLSALLGDGIWDMVSWGALALPITIIAWQVGGKCADFWIGVS